MPILNLFKVTYFWIVFISSTLLAYSLVLVVNIPGLIGFKDTLGTRGHLCANLWAKSIFNLMPGWRVDISGIENLPAPGESCVIVANHESVVDIWIMYYLGLQFKWISKIENFRLPVIGQAMSLIKYVPLERGKKESHHEALEKSVDWLKKGISMLFFPEGTRSKIPGKIQKFKIGAFKVSADANRPVLPVVICGAGDLIQKGSGMFKPGTATIRLRILPKVVKLEEESIEEYASRVRDQVVATRSEMSQAFEGSTQHLKTQTT